MHVLNRTPTSSLPHTTPYQAWCKAKPDVSHLRVWGCLAYVHVQKDKRGALGSHMERCIFIGYPAGYKGWKFYNPDTKRAIISERAVFDERYFPGLKGWSSVPLNRSLPPLLDPLAIPVPVVAVDDAGELPEARLEGGMDLPAPAVPPAVPDMAQDDLLAPAPPPARSPSPPLPPTPPAQLAPLPAPPRHPVAAPAPSPDPPMAQRRPVRNRRPPGEWWKVQPTPSPAVDSDSESEDEEIKEEAELAHKVQSGAQGSDPRTLAEALKRPDASQWHTAAQEEINAHLENHTWTPSPLPPGKKAIPCRWVLVKKHNPDGSVERYKGRLVGKGYSQRPGFDYVETFAPTVRMASIRTVLALSALEDLDLRSVDISHAFINGDLEEEIYMQQPEGFHFGGKDDVLRPCMV